MEQNREINPRQGGMTVSAGASDLPTYGLPSDDLAQFCLEPDAADSNRTLAWVNSICLLYLVIGMLGIKPPAITVNPRPLMAEEAVPTIIEPLVQPVQTVTPQDTAEESASESSPDTGPAIVAVVADSPAVTFSVPTVGNVVVSMNMAQAPPSNPLKGVAALTSPVTKFEGNSSGAPRFQRVGVTGVGGSRPPPTYPPESRKRNEQGSLVLLIEVDELGKVLNVTVKESSGFLLLDRAAADNARRHWFFDPTQAKTTYECPIVFVMQ